MLGLGGKEREKEKQVTRRPTSLVLVTELFLLLKENSHMDRRAEMSPARQEGRLFEADSALRAKTRHLLKRLVVPRFRGFARQLNFQRSSRRADQATLFLLPMFGIYSSLHARPLVNGSVKQKAHGLSLTIYQLISVIMLFSCSTALSVTEENYSKVL